jgi:hypothetical protein
MQKNVCPQVANSQVATYSAAPPPIRWPTFWLTDWPFFQLPFPPGGQARVGTLEAWNAIVWGANPPGDRFPQEN